MFATTAQIRNGMAGMRLSSQTAFYRGRDIVHGFLVNFKVEFAVIGRYSDGAYRLSGQRFLRGIVQRVLDDRGSGSPEHSNGVVSTPRIYRRMRGRTDVVQRWQFQNSPIFHH